VLLEIYVTILLKDSHRTPPAKGLVGLTRLNLKIGSFNKVKAGKLSFQKQLIALQVKVVVFRERL